MIQKINKNQELSIDFKPSDIRDLGDKINDCLEHTGELSMKYKKVAQQVCDRYTYDHTVEEFYEKKVCNQ